MKGVAVRCFFARGNPVFHITANCCLVVIVDAGLEHALVHAAQRAAPVIGKILKFGSGSNAMLGITFLRIIGIAARITKIFLHDSISFHIQI